MANMGFVIRETFDAVLTTHQIAPYFLALSYQMAAGFLRRPGKK
jgi:hypothetical protein